MADRALEERKRRIKAVREALGLTQEALLPVLNDAAQRLGVRVFKQSSLSKIEGGPQAVSFDDVAVYAAVDPKRRGKLWLAWGEKADATMAATPDDAELERLTGVAFRKRQPAKPTAGKQSATPAKGGAKRAGGANSL